MVGLTCPGHTTPCTIEAPLTARVPGRGWNDGGPAGPARLHRPQARGSPRRLTVMVRPGGEVICTLCSRPRKV